MKIYETRDVEKTEFSERWYRAEDVEAALAAKHVNDLEEAIKRFLNAYHICGFHPSDGWLMVEVENFKKALGWQS